MPLRGFNGLKFKQNIYSYNYWFDDNYDYETNIESLGKFSGICYLFGSKSIFDYLEGKQSKKENYISWILTVLYFTAFLKLIFALLSDNSIALLFMIDTSMFYPRDSVFLIYSTTTITCLYIIVNKILALTRDRKVIENYSLIKETMIDIRNVNSGLVLNYKYRKKFILWVKLFAITFPVNNIFSMIYTISALIGFSFYLYFMVISILYSNLNYSIVLLFISCITDCILTLVFALSLHFLFIFSFIIIIFIKYKFQQISDELNQSIKGISF
jgi:hypothetical protein